MSNRIFMRRGCLPLFAPFAVLIAVLFLSLPTAARAAEITYTGKAEALQSLPSWQKAYPSSLFPGTTNTPLACGNRVTIDYDPSAVDATNPEYVYGGMSELKQTANNSVVLLSGKVVKNMIGGFSFEGNAEGNTVTIVSGSVDWAVAGGVSLEGNAANNTVTINKAAIGNDVIGGLSTYGAAESNKITIGGSAVGGEVFGGRSGDSNAVNNTVTISDSYVYGRVSGGLGLFGDATGNTVTISGGLVNGRILGGVGELRATNNTITITGSPNLLQAHIFGGFTGIEYGDAFTGNTLNFKSSGISAVRVDNFEYYHFYLPESAAADEVMLSVTETIFLNGTIVEISLQGGSKLKKGDKIALIHSVEDIFFDQPKNKTSKTELDGILYEFSIYTDKKNLWAELISIRGGAK